jgi:hypothetical protein
LSTYKLNFKDVIEHCSMSMYGEVEVYLHIVSVSLILEERDSDTHWIRGWVSSKASLGLTAKRNIAAPAEN